MEIIEDVNRFVVVLIGGDAFLRVRRRKRGLERPGKGGTPLALVDSDFSVVQRSDLIEHPDILTPEIPLGRLSLPTRPSDQPREPFGRVVQTATGHHYAGEYHQRLVLTKSP